MWYYILFAMFISLKYRLYYPILVVGISVNITKRTVINMSIKEYSIKAVRFVECCITIFEQKSKATDLWSSGVAITCSHCVISCKTCLCRNSSV